MKYGLIFEAIPTTLTSHPKYYFLLIYEVWSKLNMARFEHFPVCFHK